MKLLELDIDGFRSLKSVRWNPGDLNVIIGPNGSGKSNLLRALELLSIAVQGGLNRYVLASGGMGSIVWDGQSPTVTFRAATTRPEAHATLYAQNLAYELLLERVGQTSGYVVDRELLGDFPRARNPISDVPFAFIHRAPFNNAVLYDDQRMSGSVPETDLEQRETVLSKLTGVSPFRKMTDPYRRYFTDFRIYHDVLVQRGASLREPVISRFEDRLDPDGQNLVNVLHTLHETNEQFAEDINSAMRAAFVGEFEKLTFPPAGHQRIQMEVRWRNLQSPRTAAELSDGTLRFLFLIAVLASPSPSTLIAIDEPETGLHPSMLPIIAEFAAEAAERSQVVFTTHSPQFLDAFHETVPTTTVATLEDGATKLTVLDGSNLAEWLRHFSLGNLMQSGELEAMT